MTTANQLAALGNGPAFSVYRNGAQNVSSQVNTKVAFNAEVFDTNNCFDSSSTYRFTPNVAGYYQFTFGLQPDGSNAYVISTISKNGTLGGAGAAFRGNRIDANGNVMSIASALIYMNGTTDYVEFYGYVSYTQFMGNANANDYCWAMGFLARAA